MNNDLCDLLLTDSHSELSAYSVQYFCTRARAGLAALAAALVAEGGGDHDKS